METFYFVSFSNFASMALKNARASRNMQKGYEDPQNYDRVSSLFVAWEFVFSCRFRPRKKVDEFMKNFLSTTGGREYIFMALRF